MRHGEVFRNPRAYPNPIDPSIEEIDGYPNYYHATQTPGCAKAQLQRGISGLAEVEGSDGLRRPAIQILSSPHNVGTKGNPWPDEFDVENGRIRYYGDNKTPGNESASTVGNRSLLKEYALHVSEEKEDRESAAPLIYWKKVSREGRDKGFVQFQGFGIIDRIEVVWQPSPENSDQFENFAFEFSVLSLEGEGGDFNWDWISARRNPELTAAEANQLAPQSWRQWVDGNTNIVDLPSQANDRPVGDAARAIVEASAQGRHRRKGAEYKEGELDLILNLAPTESNIKLLSKVLERSEKAIQIVYKIAFEQGPFGDNADVQVRKIQEAKKRVGINIGSR